MTNVHWALVIEVAIESCLQIQCDPFGKVILLLSVFQYTSRHGTRLDVHGFVLGMRIHGMFFMTRVGGAQGLKATSS